MAYSAVVYTSGTEYARGDSFFTEEAKRGKQLFQKYNCISCHQIYGLGGYMGPDLTNALSNRGDDDAVARAFLKSGTGKMPNFNLDESEIDGLLAYLKYIDKAGTYPIEHYELSPLGTVEVI